MCRVRTKKFEHLERKVLDKIMNIHGERGKRIVGFLNTAHQLLEIKEGLISMNFNLPKLPETIAYCIREALIEPLDKTWTRNIDQLLEDTSEVIKAKDKYLNKIEPSEDQGQIGDQGQIALIKMSEAIEGLRIAIEQVESTNERRVRKLLNEKKLQPNNPEIVILNYINLIKQTQNGVHEEASEEGLEEMWTICLDLHKEIYYSS